VSAPVICSAARSWSVVQNPLFSVAGWWL